MKRSVLILLVLMNLIWAGSYSATKHLMAQAPFFSITSMRYFLAAAPLFLFVILQYRFKMPFTDFLRCAVIGVSTFTLCPVLMYWGVSLSRASDAAILTSSEPLLVSLGAWLYLREKIDRRTAVGLLTAFGGALLISGFWKEEGRTNLLGCLLILSGVFFEACYSVLGKEVLKRHPPLLVTAFAILSACGVNALCLTILGMWSSFDALSTTDWMILAGFLAFLCTLVGYTFWYVALREGDAARVSITIFFQPAAGILIAWAWLNEVPTVEQIAGCAVILGAVALAVIRPKPHGT